MAIKKLLLALILFAFVFSVAHSESTDDGSNDDDSGGDDEVDPSYSSHFNRSSFPPDFIFGAATSAYQIEGGSEFRGINIWDVFVRNNRDKIANRSTAFIAADSYHRYKEDVRILSELGYDAYRFSISWTRLLPEGRLKSGLNLDGVTYYNELIDEVISKGMEPYATIFHWDLPQKLEEEYKGFLHQRIVDDFRDYADLCFSLFGDRVKHWITINEPWSYTAIGYAYGAFPPNRCSNRGIPGNVGFRVGRFSNYNTDEYGCAEGNSGTEPYIVTHHMLLAHAAAVEVYRKTYQPNHGGQIGITLSTQWFEPYNPKFTVDVDAVTRSLAFMFGWYMDPLFTGAYPTEMVTYVGDRLKPFSPEDAKRVKGSYDFIGLNYYTGSYSQYLPCNKSQKNYLTDACVTTTQKRDGKYIGHKTGADWLYVYPKGFHALLVHIKDKYNNPPIYVTENGVCRDDRGDRPHDMLRINYHHAHLAKLRHAIHNRTVNVKGYFAWSLIDNWEWLDGYFINYGVMRVDYDNQTLNRICKDSAAWFSSFLNKEGSLCKPIN